MGREARCATPGLSQAAARLSLRLLTPATLPSPPTPPSTTLPQFNDPPSGTTHEMLLNQHLFRLLRHCRLSAFQQFCQQSLDQFFIKVRCAGRAGRAGMGMLRWAVLWRALPMLCRAQRARARPAALPANPHPHPLTPLLPPLHSAPVQYGATATALFIYAAPMFAMRPMGGGGALDASSQGEVTADYISAMRLLSNSSK